MKGSWEGTAWALAVEVAPSAILGCGVAYSATALGLPFLSVAPLAAGVAAFAVAWLALRRVGAGQNAHMLPEFELRDYDTEVERVLQRLSIVPSPAYDDDELLLDEVVGETAELEELMLEDELNDVEEDSRVIQLFGASPTAGELRERIERHLRNAPRQVMPDATEELHEALAALRQSLR